MLTYCTRLDLNAFVNASNFKYVLYVYMTISHCSLLQKKSIVVKTGKVSNMSRIVFNYEHFKPDRVKYQLVKIHTDVKCNVTS